MSRVEVDVLVVGAGAAGIAAARQASAQGARVAIAAEGPGASVMCGGVVWGSAREPFEAWSQEVGMRAGGRYVTLSGWVVCDAAGALRSLLDLSALSENRVLGVVSLPTHPAWSPSLIASSLGATVIPLEGFVEDDSFHATARRFDTEGVVAASAQALRRAIEGRGIGALLMPPVLGLRRDDVAARLSGAVGVPVGEVAGDPGDPPSIRFARALQRLAPVGAARLRGTASVRVGRAPEARVGGELVRTRAVVLASGGVSGGGVGFGDSVRESVAGAPLWVGRERVLAVSGASRGEDPARWFSGEDPAIFRAGVRVDEARRVLGPDGVEALAPWLFAAGELLRGRAGGGIAGALATGQLAGAEAARFALGA